jgi:NAD(P)-dependent dehydrogenase (short-subunit alcohol dehydrogenase family)
MSELTDFDLTGQVVVVTGGGRGIGRAIATDVARAGATVLACSRTKSELDSLAQDIGEFGGECRVEVANLEERDEIERLIGTTVESFGRIDGLVNNAGFNKFADAVHYTAEDVDQLIDFNLKSVYWACVFAARKMIEQDKGGSIVNITSQAGVVGAPGRAPYSAAKAGVNNLTRTLAAEWGPRQIRVNAVAPTVTLTPLAREVMKQRPEFEEETKSRILLGRLAEVREMSLPTVFLLSPAASMVTGHVLVVDGGWTIV